MRPVAQGAAACLIGAFLLHFPLSGDDPPPPEEGKAQAPEAPEGLDGFIEFQRCLGDLQQQEEKILFPPPPWEGAFGKERAKQREGDLERVRSRIEGARRTSSVLLEKCPRIREEAERLGLVSDGLSYCELREVCERILRLSQFIEDASACREDLKQQIAVHEAERRAEERARDAAVLEGALGQYDGSKAAPRPSPSKKGSSGTSSKKGPPPQIQAPAPSADPKRQRRDVAKEVDGALRKLIQQAQDRLRPLVNLPGAREMLLEMRCFEIDGGIWVRSPQ